MVCNLVLEEASSDNMGNNESKDGALLAKEGTSLTKFCIVEEERVAFLLYLMNIIPRATTHMPTITNRAKMILGDRLKGWSSSMLSIMLSNISIDIGGNCNILFFSVFDFCFC